MAKLSHSDLLELRRWNTPTIYNGWEAVAKRDRMQCCMSREEITDFVPQMGPMVGYAVTVEYCCSDAKTKAEHPDAYIKLYEYLAKIPGPKVIVAKDLDSPAITGSIFGEVTGNAYRSLGCVGCINDGFVRDVDEGSYGGFKMMARRLGVSHTYSCPIHFGREIEVFGTKVKPGMLIHADKYGFIGIPEEDTEHLLEGVRFMDSNECQTTIPAARDTVGLTAQQVVEQLKRAQKEFDKNAAEFKKRILAR
ncbi:MAG: RraA family protein [Eubacteriales bacterium]|nr:RraA family protein [Eubacteriales bacterium]